MRRCLSIVFVFMLMSSLGKAKATEPFPFLNSWSQRKNHLVCIGNRVFCSAPHAQAFGLTNLYMIKDSEICVFAKRKRIESIEVFDDHTLLVHRIQKSILEDLAKAPGKETVEFLDLDQMTDEAYLSFERNDVDQLFTIFGEIYFLKHEEDKHRLYQLENCDMQSIAFQSDQRGQLYSSLYLLEDVPGFFSYQHKLRIYDFQFKEEKITDYLNLYDQYGFLEPQAILYGHILYYLSDHGIRAWNFDQQSDAELLHFQNDQYERFSLYDHYAILYKTGNESNRADIYDLPTKELLNSVPLRETPMEACGFNHSLYIFSPYFNFNPVLEYINWDTGDTYSFTIQ